MLAKAALFVQMETGTGRRRIKIRLLEPVKKSVHAIPMDLCRADLNKSFFIRHIYLNKKTAAFVAVGDIFGLIRLTINSTYQTQNKKDRHAK